MKDWDYAHLTKIASEHGGPQEYIDEVADLNYAAGYNQGHDSGLKEGIVDTIAIFGGGFLIYEVVKLIHKKIKELKAHKTENCNLMAESEKVKNDFVSNLEANAKDDTD